MNSLRDATTLLSKHVVVTSDGKTLCRECGAWTVAADIKHNPGCAYVQCVQLLFRIDPKKHATEP